MNLLFAYLYGGSEFQIIEALSLRNSYFLKVQHLDDKEMFLRLNLNPLLPPCYNNAPIYSD